MKSWRLSLFYQYLLSYILVLLIPILITGMIIYFNFLSLTKQQELQKNDEALQQIRDLVDTKFSEFMSIAFQLSSIPGLSSEETKEPLGIMNVSAALNFSVGNEAIRELNLYFHGANYLFSSETTYTPELFHHKYFKEQWDYEQFMEQMKAVRKPLLLPSASNSNDNLIKYMLPVPYNSLKPKATAIFLIKEESLKGLFNPVLRYKESNSYVFDDNDQLMLSLREDTTDDAETVRKILSVGERGSEVITLQGTPYLLSYVKSMTTGWTYATLVPRQEVMKPVNDIIYKGVLATAIIIAIGFFMIYLSMRYNYHPLRKLIDLTDRTWGPIIKDNYGLHKIKAAMIHAETLSETLRTQTEKIGPALKEYLLSELLKGRITSKHQLHEQGETVGLSLQHKRYCVQAMQFSAQANESHISKSELASRYAELLPEDMEKFVVEMIDSQMVIFILSVPQEGACLSEQFWNEIHKQYVESTGIPVTIGTGLAYDLDADCSRISSSFIEAVTAVQYKVIKGSNQVIFFQDTAMESPSLDWYPLKELERFELLLRKRQPESALAEANAMLTNMREKSSNLYAAKHISLEIVNRVMQTMNDIAGKESLEYPDVTAFVKYESFEELEATVKDACMRAYHDLKQLDQETDNLYNDMIQYIEGHACLYTFSVQSMAEHFGMSKVHLSRYFKDKANKTVMEVANDLRLEEAKRLLKETGMPLQNIVESIGYTDVSSFIRKFKQEMRLTPGEYRKLYEHQ